MNWYSISGDEALKQIGSSIDGLDDSAVQQKLAEHGKNELKGKRKISPLFIFLRQFVNVMILVLAAAAVISVFIGELSDTIVIIIITILNAVIGFIQEYRAEKAIEALQKTAIPSSRVVRNGQPAEISSTEIVPGDIILLDAGDIVPADIRLLEIESLRVNEASLTGESNAVDKKTSPLKEKDLQPGDMINMAFKGTQITSGRAKGLVVATGMKTELGNIAAMLDKAQSVTPLQKRLSQFSKKLTVVIIALCIALFFIGYLRGEEVTRMLLTSISLAVAAIPEALPAVVTISLALGAKRLLKQNVLIRKLYAVETLGSVTYICTDKTGTLTKNQMVVQDIWVKEEKKKEELLQAMSLNHGVKEKNGKLTGDPTEIAMVEYAKEQKKDYKQVKEIPFDAERKAMTTIHERDGKLWVITKGAAETISEINKQDDLKKEIRDQEEKMAKDGMRVIAFAGKEIDELPGEINPDTIEKDMYFIGLAGLMDPPREEAQKAIEDCKAAGIIPVMITGDHPLTAASIARQMGIIDDKNQEVVTGKELQETDYERLKEVEKIRVYARVSPEQKLKILEALQEKQEFVAMTGDGVNDAPSLKKANIGVAMGITGTDVAKEAAQMILLDDNFATIVKSVKTGRRVYDNIRKFIKYILTGNAAEIWIIFLAPLFGMPIPLLPIHILWINLVTDGLPALALAAEGAEKNIMKRPPRKPGESIFAQGLAIHILWVGIFIGLLNLATQAFAIRYTDSHWQTIVFTVLCFSQLWHVMAIRSETRSLFKMGVMSNKSLLLAVLFTVLLQLAVIYMPALNKFFHTQPLTAIEVLVTAGVSSIVFIVVEIEKAVKRKLNR